ncbi:hypothetical protein [Erythrobacter sp. MTPC3]|uniref:hypothetical protein n=1 Tax=Erythrobacter sp. MTPC3 TaxID=3056564 RepID=UPI0036F3E149
MDRRRRPVFLTLMLLAIAVRSVVGAPCCLDMARAAPLAAETSMPDHAHHSASAAEGGSHDNHSGNNAANPCCSACGPTLPPETPSIGGIIAPREMPQPAPIRALATRPPYPAYEATGPPILI